MRVTRCFAFLDLCGFTGYTHAHGDAAAVAQLAQLRAVLRAEAEQLGVRVTKWIGDGAMLSGVEPDMVISCCVRVRDRVDLDGALPLRGGICAGPVIMFEGDDYIGGAVNIAARLCDAAAPGQLLAAKETLPPTAAVRAGPERPSVFVPGVPDPVAVVELLALDAYGAPIASRSL